MAVVDSKSMLTKNYQKMLLNIIDLDNIDSCCFIGTDDAGQVDAEGHFEMLGRLDGSDIRGCSLLTA